MTNNPYSDPTNPYADNDRSPGPQFSHGAPEAQPFGNQTTGQHYAGQQGPEQQAAGQQWETLGAGSNHNDRPPQQWSQQAPGYGAAPQPSGAQGAYGLGAHTPVRDRAPGFGGYGARPGSQLQPRRDFSQLARIGVIGTIMGMLVYVAAIFLPFASAQDLVVASTGESIDGSFISTNLLESAAPAWISMVLVLIAAGVLVFFVLARKVQDTLAKGVVVGTALTAGVGLVIFVLSIAFDGGLRNFYDAGGSMGIGQILMYVGAAVALIGSIVTTIGVATDKTQ